MTYELRCFVCHALNDERRTSTYCTTCGHVLTVRYTVPVTGLMVPLDKPVPDPLRTRPTELKRLDRLSERYGCDIWAKLEFQNPSGCFKDRGSLLEVRKAIELQADAICLASTGNMAASVAMYAGYFDLPCYVFVPESTSEAKLAQATIFGANILRIKGDFSTCETLCQAFATSGNYYLAGDYVFREEGQKSFSFETIEQGGTDFDHVLIPVGCGTNYGAIHKGFVEARMAHLIDRIPHLDAVQPEHASPVVEGIFKREKVIKKSVTTMATAVAASDPIDFHKVLHGIDDTGGEAFTVSETEILASLREMAQTEGYYTEAACALPLACVKSNLDRYRGRKILLVLTGTGLKDAHVVAKHALPSPALDPDLPQVLEFIASGYIDIQKEAFGKPRDTLIANLKLSSRQDKILHDYLGRINRKGKTLSSNELEVLQSLVFAESDTLAYPVTVEDYDVNMRKNGLVHAIVTLNINGVEVKSANHGVGPVDAVLGAIKKESDRLVKVDVKGHQIDILSPDTNSLVVATLTLGYGEQTVQVKAASPDVIEAAVNAFVKGIAMMWRRV